MVSETSFSKALLSMALTGSFITYGAGQIISGICGDRFPPKKLILLGLTVTALMNLIIPICHNPYQMLVVWCINGFAQAFMWPPLVKLMTSLFSEEDYNKASVTISWGSSCGTIIVYFLAPFIISVSGWRAVFITSAIFGIIIAIIWCFRCPNVNAERTIRKTKSGEKQRIFTPVLIMIMIAIILQGMLRDGVTTWMPSYISETYNLSNVISILTGVIMPLFGILSYQIASHLYRRKLNNPPVCAATIFSIGTIAALALYFITGRNAAISVILSALLTGAMHGVNLILICYVPSFFRKSGSISTISGILNSCTYIGSAISTYSIAVISEKTSWNFAIIVWFITALLGTAFCFASIKPWKKEHNN